MAKTIEDILPPSRRPRPEVEEPSVDMPVHHYTPTPPPPPPSRPERIPMERGGRRFPYGTALVALIVIAGCGAALYFFSTARVEVTPTVNAVYVSSDFSATASNGDLPYELVTVQKTASQNVPSESTETANTPATGSITISNAQKVAQTLIKNTRFATPAGLIFRIHDAVTVPAATAAGPGTLTATVYADQGGAQYNVAPTSFTVPGLQGSKAFSLVTAKSSAAMTGGFNGTRPAVSQATDAAQNSANQSALASSLPTALAQKVPAGYVLVPGATYTTYQAQPDTAGPNGTVTIAEQGTIIGAVFPQGALAKAISYKTIGTYAGQDVSVPNVSSLTLKPAVAAAPDGTNPFNFTLTGNTSIVWNVDPSKIAGAVAGKTRDAAQNALAAFPEVEKAVLVLRPFWASTFPQDPSHIKVTTVAPDLSK